MVSGLCCHSLVPRSHLARRGSGDIWLISWASIAYCMHSCELITNLRTKKVLCHRVEVVKNFWCYNHRLCFLQRDWLLANSSWQINEAKESAKGHQTSATNALTTCIRLPDNNLPALTPASLSPSPTQGN